MTELLDRAARRAAIYPTGSSLPVTYSDRDIARLANTAANAAAAAARKGRIVRTANGTSRLAPQRVSSYEGAALGQEVAAAILARCPVGAAELPAPGAIAATFGGADESASPEDRDRQALRLFALGLLRDDRPQDWRDAALSVESARSGAADFDSAASNIAQNDLVGQAELEAADDPMVDHVRGRDPLTPAAQAEIYLSGLSANEQAAIRAELSSAPSAVQAGAGLAPSAGAWRVRVNRGRKSLRSPGSLRRRAALVRIAEEVEGRPALARGADRPEPTARTMASVPESDAAAALRRERLADTPASPRWTLRERLLRSLRIGPGGPFLPRLPGRSDLPGPRWTAAHIGPDPADSRKARRLARRRFRDGLRRAKVRHDEWMAAARALRS